MRSMKLLIAMAVLAAFVAGPVLAADSSTDAMTTTTSGGKAKHHKSKHHKKHGKSGDAMQSTTTGQ